jgi:hypothetical protein
MEYNISARRSPCNGDEIGAECAGGATRILNGTFSGVGLRIGCASVEYVLGKGKADLGISHKMNLTYQIC